MDVTPTPQMFAVMEKLVDAMVGEAPLKVEKTSAANKRRQHRSQAMDVLHNLVRLSMREGVARYLQAIGQPTVQDQVPPDPVSAAVQKALN